MLDQVTEQLPTDTAAAAAGALPSHSSSSSSSDRPHLQQQQQQLDKSGWWGELARAAYAAVDGSLEGYEELTHDDSADGTTAGLSGPEAEMVKVSMRCCCYVWNCGVCCCRACRASNN
jgi:hypothetical protein